VCLFFSGCGDQKPNLALSHSFEVVADKNLGDHLFAVFADHSRMEQAWPIIIYTHKKPRTVLKLTKHAWLISSLANFKLPYTINLFLPARLSSSM